ncbi:MAG: DUF4013 domain-containing protein [Polyangiaceae bacterium]|nr:DUF4013 domain-containing protein [Polyangiaceae bacterium]MCW5790689.1 DUF4013 domain-containing protein [Polyangiaceae bacterium]
MAMLPQFQAPGAEAPSPPLTAGKIEVMRAVRFALEDRENRVMNIAFGLLLQFIPVVGPITLMGWHAEILQRLVRQHPRPIPKFDFNDFVHYLQRGLVPFGVQFVFMLPVMFLWYIVTIILTMVSGALGGLIGVPEIGVLLVFATMGLSSVLLVVFLTVFLNAATLRAELCEDFGTALSFGSIWRYAGATWKRALGYGLLLALLTTVGIFLGLLAFCVGAYVVMAIITFAQTHLRYQIYAAYLAEGGAPLPIKDAVSLPSEAAPAHAARAEQYYQQPPPQG